MPRQRRSHCPFGPLPPPAARAAATARQFEPPTKLRTIECYMAVKAGPGAAKMRESKFLERLSKPPGEAQKRALWHDQCPMRQAQGLWPLAPGCCI